MATSLTNCSSITGNTIVTTRRVLIVSDHPTLARAITTGLQSLEGIEVLTSTAQGIFLGQQGVGTDQPHLVILALLQRGESPKIASEDLVRAAGWHPAIPMLIICEEPPLPTPSEAPFSYLRFPFEIGALCDRVVEILENGTGSPPLVQQALPQPKLLVVEDESIVAADLAVALRALSYDVVGTVGWAEKAVEFARATPPDIILMDIRLQGEMNGIEAAQIIQRETNIPVVFLTAHADAATLEQARQTAPYGYVLKPFEERELHSTLQMAIYRAKAEHTIRERERWLRAILQSIQEGIVATDASGRIVFLNPAAEKLIDRAWDEALNHSVVDVFQRNRAADVAEKLGSSLFAWESCPGHEPEQDLIVEETRSPIYDERAAFCGEILTIRDVTERVRSRELLQARAEELSRQNEELTAFAHTVAHDIKDPLTLVHGYASVLLANDIDVDEKDRKDGLRVIKSYTERVANIVDELLLLATVRESDIQVEPLNMSHIIARAEERLAYLRLRKGAVIKYETTDWPICLGNPSWVEEVWVNYLSNAMKYGGQPPILELGADFTDGQVRYWVRDNGPGINPEDQDKLFVPFSQLHQVRATGQGLGLSIVRRIISRLGGRVGMESTSGGSLFYFSLPVL